MEKPKKHLLTENAITTPQELIPPKPPEALPPVTPASIVNDMVEYRAEIARRGLVMNADTLLELNHFWRRSFMDKLLDPRHDIDQECGYPSYVMPWTYRELYEREGVAKRVVEIWPDECWALPPEVFESAEDEEYTEFEQKWNELSKKFRFWHMLHRADILSGLGRFGLILLGLDDGNQLDQPVRGINNFGQVREGLDYNLLFLRVFDETVVSVAQWETNLNNPRFGQPVLYNLIFRDMDVIGTVGATTAASQVTRRVHWTRVIHLADNRQMSEIQGLPRLRPVLNRVQDLRKTLGGSAEMFYKGGFPGIAFEMAPGMGEIPDTDKATLRQEFTAYQNGLQRYIALSGMTAKSLTVQVADPEKHYNIQIEYICLTLGVPKRIFLGTEEARLASSQDAKTWLRRVARRQEEYVTTLVIMPFVERLMDLGILPKVEQYEVWWPDLHTTTDTEKATIALTKTQAMQTYVAGGCDVLIEPGVYMDVVLELGHAASIDMAKAERMRRALNTGGDGKSKVPRKVVRKSGSSVGEKGNVTRSRPKPKKPDPNRDVPDEGLEPRNRE